jgi:putative ABC transport system permease protein
MGIRIALGASSDRIIFLVVRQGMVPVLLGIGIGLVVAFPVTARLASMLYGTTPTAPVVFIGTPILLGFIALLACYIPARRATQVDPMLSLRQE